MDDNSFFIPVLERYISLMGWLSGLVWCSAGLGTLSVTFGVLLYVFQDKLLYIPSIPVKNPDDNPHGEKNTRRSARTEEREIYRLSGYRLVLLLSAIFRLSRPFERQMLHSQKVMFVYKNSCAVANSKIRLKSNK